MSSIPELRPQSFTEYVKAIEKLTAKASNSLWFRGVAKSSHRLLPSLYRHSKKKKPEEIARLERDTMVWFRQRSIPFSGVSLVNDWDALFYMQHHRVPTRLLDWSESPFIGLYFAIMSSYINVDKNGNLKFDEDAAVWILDPVAWNRHALGHQSFDGGVLVTKDQELNGYLPNDTFAKMNNHAVALYGAHNSARIVAQRGVFSIFGQNLDSMDEAYVKTTFPKGCLTKIVLEKAVLVAFRKSILSYGITESVVYPDLDGLASEMRRHFGFEV